MSLTAAGPGGSDTLTKTNYVTVSAKPGDLVTTTIAYGYNPLYRLTSAVYSGTQAYTYAYDTVGNRTAMTKTITSTVVTTHVYEYDDGDRLTKVDDQTYTWDDNANDREDPSGFRSKRMFGRLNDREVHNQASSCWKTRRTSLPGPGT